MDQQEFRQLAVAEMDAVYRLAVYLTNAQEAEDLVQETFLRAFRFMSSFKATEHGMRPWLFKILHNVLNSRHSTDQKQRSAMDQLAHEGPLAADPVTEHGPLGIDWEQVDERLKAAIADLPLPYRTVFLLCAVEDLRYRDVAEITGVPIGTVMSRLYRTRGILAKRLVEMATERGFDGGAANQLGGGGDRPQGKQAHASDAAGQRLPEQ